MEYYFVEECCDILNSKRIPVTEKDRKKGLYPYYGANGVQDYVDSYIFDDELVLLAEDGGHFGSKNKPIAYRVSGRCWVNNHAHVLRPKDMIDVDYLCYSLMFYDVSGLVNGATRQKLNQSAMKKMKIPKREMGIQRRIVLELDKVKKSIEQKTCQLVELDNLIKSRFVEMFGDPIANLFGWKKVVLGDLVYAIQSGNTPKGGKQVYVNSGIAFFRSQNVWRNRVDYEDIAYIDEKTHRKMYKTSLRKNDILITKTGRFNTENSSLGRAAMYQGDDNQANINGHVYLIRLKEVINPNFVLFILTTDEYRDYIRKVCVGGIDKRQINKEHLEEFPIILPPNELQNQFADFVQQVDKSKVAIQRSLDETQELFDCLMQKYFG